MVKTMNPHKMGCLGCGGQCRAGIEEKLLSDHHFDGCAISLMEFYRRAETNIRPLAEELRVNRNTIAKAYSELENLGVIETQPGKGCFLKENHSPLRSR